ncbi:MAG TPA: hypothetical protein VFB59_01340 [Candidatus Saccharimonadales bacterium]|nr:hypothetical protein [Candidatus Saccharimonadales bacterium]
MAITITPTHIRTEELLTCVICGRERPLADLTAGLTDATGRQALACAGHTWDAHELITGWAKFAITQRQALAQAAAQMEYREDIGHGQRVF